MEQPVTHVFFYIVAASSSPDKVKCTVPYRIDDGEVFFGPCKKILREWMCKHYLNENFARAEPTDDVYVVGFNGSNASKNRKIVWIGKLTSVMTFSLAWELTGRDSRYKHMREHKFSPLHIRPVMKGGRLVGYEHESELPPHNWVMDLVKWKHLPSVTRSGNQLLLQDGASPRQGFPRDVCMFFENLFFATGHGLPIDGRLLSILQDAQPEHNVDDYAVFGYTRAGHANGKRGSCLHLTGVHADEFVKWVGSLPSVPPIQSKDPSEPPGPRGDRGRSSRPDIAPPGC